MHMAEFTVMYSTTKLIQFQKRKMGETDVTAQKAGGKNLAVLIIYVILLTTQNIKYI